MPLLTRVINIALGWWSSWGDKKNRKKQSNKPLPRNEFPPQPPPPLSGNSRSGPVNTADPLKPQG